MHKTTLSLALTAIAATSLQGAIFLESFDTATLANTRSGAAGVNGATYTGVVPWQVASNGPASPNETSWAVNTGLGWTANDAGSNQYLFADSTGSLIGGDSAVFRSFGWNTSSDEILTVSFEFAFQPEDDDGSGTPSGNGNWGALVMSSNSGLGSNVETVAGSGDQQVHVRFTKDGDVVFQNDTLIGSGAEFTTGLSALNTFSMTYNGSASAYSGIDSGNASLTINGSLIDGNFDIGHSSNTDGAVTLNYMELRSFGGLDDEGGPAFQGYFDDVAIDAVPEPSAYALIGGLIALASIGMRRNRR